MVEKRPMSTKTFYDYHCSFCGEALCNSRHADAEEYALKHETYECVKNPKRKDWPTHRVEGGRTEWYVTLNCCKCKKDFEIKSDNTRYCQIDHGKRRKCPHCGRTTKLDEYDCEDIDLG